MLKFIRGKGTHASHERLKVQRDLFAFRKTATHGFPSKPTSLAYDRKLGLLAIGTKSGGLKVVGKPGVEFIAEHPQDEDAAVEKIIFIANHGRILTLCDDNSLHLWQIKNSNSTLELIKSYSLEGKLKKISSLTLKADETQVLVGTVGGNIYTLNLQKFEMTDKIIYLDVVLQNGPESYKSKNPGAVESIMEHLQDSSKLIIGYERGLIVMWDVLEQRTIKSYVNNQQLEDLSWINLPLESAESLYFVSSHNDGSYVIWDINNNEKPFRESTVPYGPYPCKKISKTRIYQQEGKKPNGFLMIFNGGMPRAAYGDHNTVTIMKDSKSTNNSDDEDSSEDHVVYDLTSRVIDFIVIEELSKTTTAEQGRGNETEQNEVNEKDLDKYEPSAVVILAEEELVVLDLKEDKWPIYYPQPYLNLLHPSAVTANHIVSNVSKEVFDCLKNIGLNSFGDASKLSKNEWPIKGGIVEEIERGKDLLITGHEDGQVRFWDCTGICLSLLCMFKSSTLFNSDEMLVSELKDSDSTSEEWPPFRKAGVFDPYTDDPRLAIKKLSFCPKTGVLIVGGTAGQVIIVNSLKKQEENKLEVNSCNLVAEKDGFVWKGHESLKFRPKNNPNLDSGRGLIIEQDLQTFSVSALLQIQPPAAITALSLEASSGVMAVGTAHGVLLYDFFRKKIVMTKSTLNPNDIMAAGDTPISRRKSIKKSLRESFRRLRKGRSQRSPTGPSNKIPNTGISLQSPEINKPMERAIEARSNDDAMTSMVRFVGFSKTFIISLQTTTPTLWVGTNAGSVLVFLINVPGGEKRLKEDVVCNIAKEIQLKHRAPVLSVIVLDCVSNVVDGFTPKHDHLGPHKVLIGSEEQLKIFTLPGLRPSVKLKLTAQEGSRMRKLGVSTFYSSSDKNYFEKCLNCVTNQGDLFVITIPDLRRQIAIQCIRREDISGIYSFVFNENGEGFYLCSSSEMQRISLSAKKITKPRCSIKIENIVVEEVSKENMNEREIKSPSNIEAHEQNAQNETKAEEVAAEIADITIDSVRDHMGNQTSNNNSGVEERLIDGSASASNDSKKVSVSTSVVQNSIEALLPSSQPAAAAEVLSTSIDDVLVLTENVSHSILNRAPLASIADEDRNGE